MITKKQKYHGFTLVELIVVVVILGILSATALPKFIKLRTESILATMDGLDAALETATTLAHAKSLLDRTDHLASTTINYEGIIVDMVYGYPAGTANGISKIVLAPDGDWKQRASSVSGAWIFWHGVINEDAGAAGCYLRYRSSTGPGARPVIDYVKGGCATAE